MSNRYQIMPDLTAEEYEALKADIAARGLQVPIEYDEQGNVLDGFHRLRACEELGVKAEPSFVRVGLSEDEKVEHALMLNLARRHLTKEQLIDLVKMLAERGWSTTRISDRLPISQSTVSNYVDELTTIGKLQQPDRVIGKDGKSRPARKPTVMTKTEKEQQQTLSLLSRVKSEMLPTEVIDLNAVKKAKRETDKIVPKVGETPEYPSGKYRCIAIDPPWPVQKIEREVRPNQGTELDYPVMSMEEIEALPIAELAEPSGCHIYLWTTHKLLPDALRIFEGWGANYQCLMTWVKPTGMTPFSWMYDTEHVLFGRIGNLKLVQNGLKLSFRAPVTRHSEKPEIFYERVRLASPEPRLEMFARKEREGFTVWGDEVEGLADRQEMG